MNPSPKCCEYSGRLSRIVGWGAVLFSLLGASYLTVTSKFSDVLKRPLNPLALNSSPYGMLLSSLLQQPVNTEWHKGVEVPKAVTEGGHEHEHDDKETEGKSGHHHVKGDHCEECDSAAGRFVGQASEASVLDAFARKLEVLAKTHSARTNPKEISPAHKLHIARNIEKKLLLAYNLDPTNYAAYDAYFLFLTENVVAGLGSPEKIKQAQLITELTLEFSSREQINPLPALTTALATFNRFMLNVSLRKSKDENFNRMLYGKVAEQLARYERLKAVAISTGDWDLVPEAWRLQADERAHFVNKVAESLVGKPPDKKSP